MAKCEVQMPDNLLSLLLELGDKTDTICEKALKEGAEVMFQKMKANLKAVVGKNTKYPSRSTGELVDSLGISPAGVNRKGDHDIKIGFAEPRTGGTPNGKIAAILEYGKAGQPPKPFMKPAKVSGKKKTVERMQAVFEEEVRKL